MSWNTLKNSIDFYFEHNHECDTAIISFYGGEALLDFNNIRKAIDYARSLNDEMKPLRFYISSNGTTLTPRVISWLEENDDVELTITLNGYQHDRYRRFPSGRGSLKTILSSIKQIKDASPALWNRIDFIANIVTCSELIALREFYKIYVEKPPILITGIYSQNGNEKIQDLVRQQDDSKKHLKIIRDLYIEHADLYIKPYFNFNMVEITNRPIGPVENQLRRTSCCMPFTSALFVDSDGSFGMCEKVGADEHLGNVNSGINEEAVTKLMETTMKAMNKQCRSCWAQRLCTACYQDFKRDMVGNYYIVPEICDSIRQDLEEDLQMFCEIRERNIELFDELASVY